MHKGRRLVLSKGGTHKYGSVRVFSRPVTSVLSGPDTLARRRAFGKVPLTVFSDDYLFGNDIRVYAAMAWMDTDNDGIVSVGLRLIASQSCMSRSGAAGCIERLIICGHIERLPAPSKHRATYRLTGPVFEKTE
jgi:hypothetical protein